MSQISNCRIVLSLCSQLFITSADNTLKHGKFQGESAVIFFSVAVFSHAFKHYCLTLRAVELSAQSTRGEKRISVHTANLKHTLYTSWCSSLQIFVFLMLKKFNDQLLDHKDPQLVS